MVDACYMDIKNLTVDDGARVVDFKMLTPRGGTCTYPPPRLALRRGASARSIIFLPFTGNLVPVVLTTEPPANYRGCRPAHPGRSGVVDACYMDIKNHTVDDGAHSWTCLLYTSPSPRDKRQSRMPSSA